MNTFDELFEQFFNNNEKKEDKNKENIKPSNEVFDPKEDFILNLFDELKNSDLDSPLDLLQMLDSKMGKPVDVKVFEKDGKFIKKETWETPSGGLVTKTIVSETPFDENTFEVKEKTLEEQLKEAVANEEYEKAAILRNKINEKKFKNT